MYVYPVQSRRDLHVSPQVGHDPPLDAEGLHLLLGSLELAGHLGLVPLPPPLVLPGRLPLNLKITAVTTQTGRKGRKGVRARFGEKPRTYALGATMLPPFACLSEALNPRVAQPPPRVKG